MALTDRDLVLGIDFGMSTVSACGFVDGRLQFVVDSGERLIPCAVHIPNRGEPTVGRRAIYQLIRSPSNTITNVKRLLGRKATDPEIRRLDAGVGYQITAGPDQRAMVTVRGEQLAPEQLAGFVFRRIRELASVRFGRRIHRAIVTVPVTATQDYCQALRAAARLGGLQVEQLVPEPVAGCLAHGMHGCSAHRRIAVCDFGGGTFDATLIHQDELHFECAAMAGDDLLGGVDFDFELAEAVAGYAFRAHGADLHRDTVKWQELLWRCESVKRQLSRVYEAPLVVRDAFVSGRQSHDMQLSIDRAWIEPRWASLTERAIAVLEGLLATAGTATAEVDEVLLIGGTTLMPLVRRAITEFFGRPISTTPHADVAVSVGAALQTGDSARVCTQVPQLALRQ